MCHRNFFPEHGCRLALCTAPAPAGSPKLRARRNLSRSPSARSSGSRGPVLGMAALLPEANIMSATGRPSPSWVEEANGAAAAAGVDRLLVITLETGNYWPRQRNILGQKEVELGRAHTTCRGPDVTVDPGDGR